MHKLLAFGMGVLALALAHSPATADNIGDNAFVCVDVQHAALGAAAMRSLYLLDGRGITVTKQLKQEKHCWFEAVSIPEKYTPLTRVYIQEGASNAYAVVPLQVGGVQRFVVVFEEGAPVIDI